MRRIVSAFVLALAFAAPAAAQDWVDDLFPATSTLMGDFRVLVNVPDPAAPDDPGEYHIVTLRTLLAGLVEFPDNLRRYIAVKPFTAGETEPPTAFEQADFTGAGDRSTVGVSQTEGIPLPPLTRMMPFWLAVAVPEEAGINYYSVGQSNTGFNVLRNLTMTATAMLDDGSGTDEYEIWTAGGSFFAIPADIYVFFSQTATVPTPTP